MTVVMKMTIDMCRGSVTDTEKQVRYERPRYNYDDEVVVVRPRRVVVDDDYGYRPRYVRSRHQGSFFRMFFGGF